MEVWECGGVGALGGEGTGGVRVWECEGEDMGSVGAGGRWNSKPRAGVHNGKHRAERASSSNFHTCLLTYLLQQDHTS